MDESEKIQRLAGEAMALRNLIIELTRTLILHDPTLVAPLHNMFSDLEGISEVATIQCGEPGSVAYLTGFVEAIEEVRAAIFKNGPKPDRLV